MTRVQWRPADKSARNGFTLVEVMVALLVISMAVSALLVQIMGNADTSAYLRDKTIANWVALNQLEIQYLENRHSNRLLDRELSGTEKMAGREWYWRIKPLKTAADGFVQLQVTVSDSEDSDSALVTVMGLIDQYHRPIP